MENQNKNKNMKLLSMAQAAKITPYEQGYLSLLARRGILKSEKIANKWYTTIEWLNDYLREKKPEAVIKIEKVKELEKKQDSRFWSNLLFIFVFLVLLSGILYWFFLRTEKLEQETLKQADFTSDEIIKVPNEEGNYDVYRSGRIKVE